MQVRASREAVQTTLNAHCEHVNKQVVGQMQALKARMKSCQDRMEEIKVQQRMKAKKGFERARQRLQGQIEIQFAQTKKIV
jgi:dsDNA-specific endonuclease/ATPase MutS2